MPLQATSGAASYDAFGGGVPVVPNYIEDVFSTYLYTGTGSAQTITNGIDLSTQGGLVWIKNRTGAQSHNLYDTARGRAYRLASQSTAAQTGPSGSTNDLTSFNTNGFSLGTEQYSNTNDSAFTYASWTFRKQPKFFDVVTYTGNSVSGRAISHNLGSAPGMVITKCLNNGSLGWVVWHRSLASTSAWLRLDGTDAVITSPAGYGGTFGANSYTIVNDPYGALNANGSTYVAYLFAHNAGGFGLTGTDNVISCGTFAANNGEVINLGYEPQWLLYKDSSSTSNWRIADTMRGFTNLSGTNAQTIKQLSPNTSSAESDNSGPVLTSTGFTWNQSGGGNVHIYIAIRRGPMKVPTSGTSVFNTVLWTGNQTNNRQITGVGFNPDFVEAGTRSAATTFSRGVVDRLRGTNPFLVTYETGGENANSDLVSFDNDGITVDYISSGIFNNNSNIYGHFFRRAPSFFDEVCYTGNGGINNVQNHSLADSIGMLIIKRRDSTGNWSVFVKESGGNYSYWNSSGTGTGQGLNGTGAPTGTNYSGYNSYLTSTTFNAAQIAGSNDINANGGTYVAYLFATCAGVSKVFSYTGNGSSQTINCGFTAGSRWVMIKRTDSTGDWYVWDSARGIVAGNDPHLSLNTTAAEVTTDDSVDTDNTGFIVNQVAATNVNVSSATYIGIAIA